MLLAKLAGKASCHCLHLHSLVWLIGLHVFNSHCGVFRKLQVCISSLLESKVCDTFKITYICVCIKVCNVIIKTVIMIAADYTNGLFPCFLKTHFQVIMMSMHYFVIKRIEMLF